MPGAGCTDVVREARGGGGHRGSAGGIGFAGQVPEDAGGKPATGPGLCSAPAERRARGGSPGRACGGHGGPEAAGQGPCRNPRQKHLSRSVRIAAGAIRAEGPEEGQVDKPAFASCRPPPAGCRTASGEFRAARVQRHPRCGTLAGRRITNTHPRGTARVRPSGLLFPTPRRHCCAGRLSAGWCRSRRQSGMRRPHLSVVILGPRAEDPFPGLPVTAIVEASRCGSSPQGRG